MTSPLETQEGIYNKFQTLGKQFQQLGGIVQNAGFTRTHAELDEYEARLSRLLVEMKKMNHVVISYYQREKLIK